MAFSMGPRNSGLSSVQLGLGGLEAGRLQVPVGVGGGAVGAGVGAGVAGGVGLGTGVGFGVARITGIARGARVAGVGFVGVSSVIA
jgi:hypothetical protein